MNNIKTRSDRIAVIVLGMHRSGTSALAGVLGLLGCDEPETLMIPNENNKKGYFESSKLYQLHAQLFASAGTRWDDWLPMPAGWFKSPPAAAFHDRAVETVTAEFGKSRLFMIKDPRICRLVPFWEGVLAEIKVNPGYVLTHRNPLEVAASLQKRDGLSVGHGLLIWLRHVLEAERSTRSRSRCFTSFAQLITNWAGVADKIQSGLDLSLPRFALGAASDVDTFLEDSLRHHQESSEKVLHNPMLSVWIRDSYEIFERWAISGEDVSDHERLDAIRTAFDASAPAFAQVIQSDRAHIERLSGNAEALQEVRAEFAEREREHQRANEMFDRERAARVSAEARTAELDDRVQTQFRELSELSHILAQEQNALKQRSHEADENYKALEALRGEIAEREREHQRANEMFERERAARVSAEVRTAELDDQVQTQFRELSELSHILAQEQSALKQRSHEADENYKALEALRGEIAEAGVLERQLRDEIAALHSSTSWKVSAPVRFIGRLVKRHR